MKLRLPRIILFPLAIFGVAGAALAADPSGRWQWTTTSRAGQVSQYSAQIQLRSGSLSGTVSTPRGDRRFDGGTFTGNSILFSITLSNGATAKYSGTLNGDTITGTIQVSGPQGTISRDWTARRDPMHLAPSPGS
jgi:hypothetical protein